MMLASSTASGHAPFPHSKAALGSGLVVIVMLLFTLTPSLNCWPCRCLHLPRWAASYAAYSDLRPPKKRNASGADLSLGQCCVVHRCWPRDPYGLRSQVLAVECFREQTGCGY